MYRYLDLSRGHFSGVWSDPCTSYPSKQQCPMAWVSAHRYRARWFSFLCSQTGLFKLLLTCCIEVKILMFLDARVAARLYKLDYAENWFNLTA